MITTPKTNKKYCIYFIDLTFGSCAFPVDVSLVWNSLPALVQSTLSVTVFCHKLQDIIVKVEHY